MVITTPNVEYNRLFETLPAGSLRNRDHRSEWTRDEFADWSKQAARSFDYEVVLDYRIPVRVTRSRAEAQTPRPGGTVHHLEETAGTIRIRVRRLLESQPA